MCHHCQDREKEKEAKSHSKISMPGEYDGVIFRIPEKRYKIRETNEGDRIMDIIRKKEGTEVTLEIVGWLDT